MKRRQQFQAPEPPSASEAAQLTETLASVGSTSELLAQFNSGVFAQQLAATTQLRKMLSIERDPPIDKVVELGVVPQLLEFLCGQGVGPGAAPEDAVKLQFEAAWAVTNIASGTAEQTAAVVRAGAVERFAQLLSHPNEELRDQCVWALGNVAGDGPQCRDYCLQHGIMERLLSQFADGVGLSIIRNSCWALSNLCRGKPQPPLALVRPALPVLAQLIEHPDADTVTDAAWAFSYVSDGDNDRIEAVVQSGAVTRLVALLGHQSPSVQTPALRAVGNVVTGTAQQTQAVVDLAPFGHLLQLLASRKKALRKEACWTLSNITAGTPAQIQAVISAGIMPSLVSALQTETYEIKKEACWALSNATSGGRADQIRMFVTPDLLRGLIELVANGVADDKLTTVALEALENVLAAGEMASPAGGSSHNIYVDRFEELDGVEMLEEVQRHENVDLYEKATAILDTYFAEYDEEDDDDDDADEGAQFQSVAAAGGAHSHAAQDALVAAAAAAAASVTGNGQSAANNGAWAQATQQQKALTAAPVVENAQPQFSFGGPPANGNNAAAPQFSF